MGVGYTTPWTSRLTYSFPRCASSLTLSSAMPQPGWWSFHLNIFEAPHSGCFIRMTVGIQPPFQKEENKKQTLEKVCRLVAHLGFQTQTTYWRLCIMITASSKAIIKKHWPLVGVFFAFTYLFITSYLHWIPISGYPECIQVPQPVWNMAGFLLGSLNTHLQSLQYNKVFSYFSRKIIQVPENGYLPCNWGTLVHYRNSLQKANKKAKLGLMYQVILIDILW